MSMLIKDEQTLRGLLPNVFRSVSGEVSFLDKMTPFLNQAEGFATAWLCPEKLLDGLEDRTARDLLDFVAAKAFEMAVPSLDLVLTPNGFGVVSNENIAPASRERVEELMRSLRQRQNYSAERFVERMHNNQPWIESRTGNFWRTTFLNTPAAYISEEEFRSVGAVEMAVQRQPVVIHYERMLAERAVGSKLMRRLRDYPTQGERFEVTLLRGMVVRYIRQTMLLENLQLETHEAHEAMVLHIRANIGVFPEWIGSEAEELWRDHGFKNTKNSTAFFF